MLPASSPGQVPPGPEQLDVAPTSHHPQAHRLQTGAPAPTQSSYTSTTIIQLQPPRGAGGRTAQWAQHGRLCLHLLSTLPQIYGKNYPLSPFHLKPFGAHSHPRL